MEDRCIGDGLTERPIAHAHIVARDAGAIAHDHDGCADNAIGADIATKRCVKRTPARVCNRRLRDCRASGRTDQAGRKHETKNFVKRHLAKVPPPRWMPKSLIPSPYQLTSYIFRTIVRYIVR